MRTRGSAEELERRRFRAVELMERGESPTVIGRILGVSRASLSRWRSLGRTEALKAKPHPGRPACLTDEDLRRLEEVLSSGATAQGWANNLWTCRRVRTVIKRHFGVEYHPGHVARLLRERLGWTVQRPDYRHADRDDEKIRGWLTETFPAVVKAAQVRAADLAFIDEAGFMLEPTARRTYAPCGQTPILVISGPHQRISTIAAVVVCPRTGRVRMEYGMLADNVNFRWPAVLQFVRTLRSKLGRPLMVFWDQIAIHTCPSLRERLDEDPGLAVEPFPQYAPELNPADGVWRYVKYGRIPNYAPPDLGALRSTLTAELGRVRRRPDLLGGVHPLHRPPARSQGRPNADSRTEASSGRKGSYRLTRSIKVIRQAMGVGTNPFAERHSRGRRRAERNS
jgi:transposase